MKAGEIVSIIGSLLPKDGYLLRLKASPTIDYSQSLTHLYQPLIGLEATSLYQTLLNDYLTNKPTIQTHHALMNYLNMALPDIYELRLKLEAIGLIRTYKEEKAGQTTYTYELQPPFSPEAFFEETMLSELLLHHIGKSRFEGLRDRFVKKREAKGGEITASFDSVFQTLSPRMGIEPTRPEDSARPLIANIDFSWLELILKQRMLPVRKILTGKNKQIISELSHLYNLASHEIEKAILWAITDEHTIDIEQLKQAAQDLYTTKPQATSIRLEKRSGQAREEPDYSSMTREEMLIHRFETMSPRQLLEDLSSGARASERDLKIISEVMLGQKLPKPVMNVLLHYALMQSNMKLSKPYLETIASHWARANLQTAKEAMDFAKAEINDYKNRKNKRTNRRSRQEVIPDWFKERENKASGVKAETPQSQAAIDQEEIMKRLQRHASKKQ